MLPDGVLMVRFAGPLTGPALAAFKESIASTHLGGVRSFVVDYTAAVVALSGADLDAVLEGESPDTAPGLPCAMIVRRDCNSLFRGHAVRMAAHGILRRCFNDEAPAVVWATARARALAL